MQQLRLISRIENGLTKNVHLLILNKASPGNSNYLRKQVLEKQNFTLNNLILPKSPLQVYSKKFSNLSSNKTFQKLNNEDNGDEQNVIFTIPNILTSLRILSIPFVNYLVFINKHEYACALFLLAGFTDFFDGYIARNWKNQKSYLGSILDPLADKLLIGSLTITLTLNDMLPIQLALVIIMRDLCLIMASLFVRYRTLEKPVTWSTFLNVKKSRVQVEADYLSKMNTVLQLALITFTLPSVAFNYLDSEFLTLLQWITGTTTVMSSISYLYKGGSYKVIKK
jgi:cardiolipin synthase (CMP-forming)